MPCHIIHHSIAMLWGIQDYGPLRLVIHASGIVEAVSLVVSSPLIPTSLLRTKSCTTLNVWHQDKNMGENLPIPTETGIGFCLWMIHGVIIYLLNSDLICLSAIFNPFPIAEIRAPVPLCKTWIWMAVRMEGPTFYGTRCGLLSQGRSPAAGCWPTFVGCDRIWEGWLHF